MLSFILVLAGLLLIMESQLISSLPEVTIVKEELFPEVTTVKEELLPEVTIVKEEGCSPRIRNTSDIEYHSGHRYYSALKDMDPPTIAYLP
ncbi:hypothetical protein V7S43_013808 [Phytophthora oleae]|uniref:Uncharacterized protein n=1 Tax=Phytophthora oleae TaxID=2107226 RepID=A0ABD3F490_9STRA